MNEDSTTSAYLESTKSISLEEVSTSVRQVRSINALYSWSVFVFFLFLILLNLFEQSNIAILAYTLLALLLIGNIFVRSQLPKSNPTAWKIALVIAIVLGALFSVLCLRAIYRLTLPRTVASPRSITGIDPLLFGILAYSNVYIINILLKKDVRMHFSSSNTSTELAPQLNLGIVNLNQVPRFIIILIGALLIEFATFMVLIHIGIQNASSESWGAGFIYILYPLIIGLGYPTVMGLKNGKPGARTLTLIYSATRILVALDQLLRGWRGHYYDRSMYYKIPAIENILLIFYLLVTSIFIISSLRSNKIKSHFTFRAVPS